MYVFGNHKVKRQEQIEMHENTFLGVIMDNY